MISESRIEWNSTRPASRNAPATAAASLPASESAPCCMRVISVMKAPASSDRQTASRSSGASTKVRPDSTAVAPSSGRRCTTSHITSQPPTRLATSVPDHSLASCARLARPATTAVTGTRKPSVNSSLLASKQVPAGFGVDGQQRDDPGGVLQAAGEPGGQHLPPGAVQPLGPLVDDPVEGLDDLVLLGSVGGAQLLACGLRHGRPPLGGPPAPGSEVEARPDGSYPGSPAGAHVAADRSGTA